MKKKLPADKFMLLLSLFQYDIYVNQIGRKTEEKRQIVHLSNRIDNGKGKTNKCLHTYVFFLHFDSITIIFGFLFEFTLPDQKISNKNAKMPTFFQSVRFAAAAHGFE